MEGFNVVCQGLAGTESVAEAVAGLLRPGDAILLDGKLAAGKTHFVKALAKALGSADAVTSPTYAIAHVYDTAMGRLLHVDAYRLSGPAEFRDLGLDGYFADSITVVEWGRIVADEFADHLAIDLDFTDADDTVRTLTFSCAGDRWPPVLATLQRLISDRLE
jgi:tRNA threonylcarbamoyladenosine biosynthesis protein TsaE